MRKGYWKTLLRRLRGRVASGADTFVFHQTGLMIADVLASSDDPLDSTTELPLASTADGITFFINPGHNRITIRANGASASEAVELDLAGFIEALSVRDGATLELGTSIDDADLPELRGPDRKPLLGD